MRVPLSWIREFAPIPGTPGEVADLLNGLGLIVDAVEQPGREISGVVVARVLEVLEHPNADKLTLVDVDAGDRQVRVVCGARNLTAGDVVPWAPPGATLPGGFTLESRKIRGERSEGMLCSAKELGLGDDHEGILHLEVGASLGSDVREVLGLDDAVFELDVTPNRPDAMSVVGVARDLAAKTGVELSVPEPTPRRGGPSTASVATVEIDAPERCPRYVASTGTVEMGPSPDWLARRLVMAGMRPISNVVDVTNYVLLERGQPLHAFDLELLGGHGIRVRLARPGERMRTLDGIERELSPEDLLICDADDVPQALAGIMGGETSEVNDATTRVLLESAYFTPEGILRTSKRLAVRSESSARFERGVDPGGALAAAWRAWELLEEVAAGLSADEAIDAHPAPVERERIVVRPRRVSEVLGAEIDADTVRRHLSALGMQVEAGGGDGDGGRARNGEGEGALTVTVPTFRPDLEREIDLVEEVARLHGYNVIERTLPRPKGQVGGLSREQRERRVVRDALVGAGLCEAMNLALVAASDLERAGRPGVGIEVENPLRAEESILRPAVLPGLLRSVAFNAAHGVPDTALFEVGHVFLPPPDGQVLPDEREHVAATVSGSVTRRPHEEDRPVDVHDAVGLVGVLSEALELADWRMEPARRPGFHPGRCAAIFVDGEEAGTVGEVAPEVVTAMELPSPVVAFEVDLDRFLAGSRRDRRYRPVSRYPASGIDLAFVVGSDVPAARVEETLAAAGGDLLEELELFDVFESPEALGEGRRSLAFRLRFRAPDRTLTDEEVAGVRQACIDAVTTTHAAELRA